MDQQMLLMLVQQTSQQNMAILSVLQQMMTALAQINQGLQQQTIRSVTPKQLIRDPTTGQPIGVAPFQSTSTGSVQ